METSKSNFLIGLAIGSASEHLLNVFHVRQKQDAKKRKFIMPWQRLPIALKALQKPVRDKALDASTKTADKVADATFDVAEKADTLKSKVHAAALEAKK